MGLFTLIVYGVGDMVGSGIYATIGRAAGAMGNAVWLAFLASMVAALLTGLSYASIASRYPRAAGAAYVTHRAFHLAFLSYVVGLAVTASGLTSMATSTNAFAETLHHFVKLPIPLLILGFLAVLAFLNFWGMRESMWANLLCTGIEVGGLLFIIAIGMRYWGGINYLETPAAVVGKTSVGLGPMLILNGAVLTFFSFVGFEDMLNVSEEVKNPQRTMPWGIVIALGTVTVIYIAISITAVSVVNYRELGDPKLGAPLVQITNRAAPWVSPWVFSFITMFAVANTALINYIMGSRLVYGMARQGLVPAVLGKVHERRRTPHVSILVLLIIVIVLALAGNISQLASATSLLLLTCFMIVNAALIVLKHRPGEAKGQFEVPTFVPAAGVLVCGAIIFSRLATRNAAGHYDWTAPMIAGGLLIGIGLLYLIVRPKAITEETLAEVEHEH
jgi:basic amino acid/polyamine antiporter, APA family